MWGAGAAGKGQWESGGGLGRVKSAVFPPEGHEKTLSLRVEWDHFSY